MMHSVEWYSEGYYNSLSDRALCRLVCALRDHLANNRVLREDFDFSFTESIQEITNSGRSLTTGQRQGLIKCFRYFLYLNITLGNNTFQPPMDEPAEIKESVEWVPWGSIQPASNQESQPMTNPPWGAQTTMQQPNNPSTAA